LTPPGFTLTAPALTSPAIDSTLVAAITTIQATMVASQEHTVSLTLEQEHAMGAALTAQMATAQRLILGHLSVAHEAPPVTLEAPLASGLDADHIAALHAQAAGMHNIRSLVSIVLDPASSHYPRWRGQVLMLRRYALADHVLDDLVTPPSPSWYQMDSVVLSWLHGTITVELQDIICNQENTARQAWLAVEGQFLENREAQALHLDAQFYQFSQGGSLHGRILPPNEGMADSLLDLDEPTVDRTLVLKLLRGLSPRYSHMKALIKKILPFPTFYAVRNELLEELTLETKAPAPASTLYSVPTGGEAASGARPLALCRLGLPLALHPLSLFRLPRRWRSPFQQGRARERWLHPRWSLQPRWRLGVAVILQPLDWDHRHVVGPDSECLPPSCAGPPDRASLRRAPSNSTPAPASEDLHLDTLVPAGWRVGPSCPHCRLGAPLWCVLPQHLQHGHVIPLIPPQSLLDHRWKRCHSVGHLSSASALLIPFYLNDVLVAPHITHNLLFVHRFTTGNFCSIEFDPFGFSVKYLATRTPLARCESSRPLYTL
jgi:hypothetical protein